MTRLLIDRLERSFLRAYSMRDAIWNQVRGGHMPPGEPGRMVVEHPMAPRYWRDGAPWDVSASLASEGGREVLRNWLACGTPVVERTEPCAPTDPACNSVGFTFEAACRTSEDCFLPAQARASSTRAAATVRRATRRPAAAMPPSIRGGRRSMRA